MEEVSPAVALLSQKPIWNSQGSWESCWVKATATSNTQLKIPTASIRFRRLRVLFLVEDDVSDIPRILQSPTNSLIHGRFNPQSTAHFFGVFNSPGGSQDELMQREEKLGIRKRARQVRKRLRKKATNTSHQGMFLMEYFFKTI
ncbi:hypothetical protein HID58_035086 [Brassica napus]|uniref:Uncharacterized protein n=1 Tax=Brassica napus TaxID=3708 RepID=A0ABQ8C3X1_BRANA|nr:hypothetical protein HID58_035086 [Brassica napus]